MRLVSTDQSHKTSLFSKLAHGYTYSDHIVLTDLGVVIRWTVPERRKKKKKTKNVEKLGARRRVGALLAAQLIRGMRDDA